MQGKCWAIDVNTMNMQKFALPLLLLAAIVVAYCWYYLAKRLIDPRRSFGNALLFMLLNLLLIVLLSFAFSFLIFRYKEFFIKG